MVSRGYRYLCLSDWAWLVDLLHFSADLQISHVYLPVPACICESGNLHRRTTAGRGLQTQVCLPLRRTPPAVEDERRIDSIDMNRHGSTAKPCHSAERGWSQIEAAAYLELECRCVRWCAVVGYAGDLAVFRHQ